MRSECFMGIEFQFGTTKKCGGGGGEGRTTLRMSLMPLKCTLKND